MGVKKQLPGEDGVGFVTTGAIDHVGNSVSGYVPYVCLVDGQGNEVSPTGNGGSWNYPAPATGLVPITTNTVMKAAAGAGVRNVIDSLQISHDALGAAVELIILDGATVIHRIKLQIAATEGITIPLKLRGTANTALNYTFSAATTGTVYVNAQGHTET